MSTHSYFDKLAPTYKSKSHRGLFRFLRDREKRAVLKISSELEYQSLIDLGAGTGFYTDLLKRSNTESFAVDQSQKMLKNLATEHQIIHSSIENLKLNRSFDLVTAIGVLEFTSSPQKSFSVISKLMHQKSHAVILLPHTGMTARCYQTFHRVNGNKIQLYSKNRIDQLLQENQLQLISRTRVFPLNWLCLVRKTDE